MNWVFCMKIVTSCCIVYINGRPTQNQGSNSRVEIASKYKIDGQPYIVALEEDDDVKVTCNHTSPAFVSKGPVRYSLLRDRIEIDNSVVPEVVLNKRVELKIGKLIPAAKYQCRMRTGESQVFSSTLVADVIKSIRISPSPCTGSKYNHVRCTCLVTNSLVDAVVDVDWFRTRHKMAEFAIQKYPGNKTKDGLIFTNSIEFEANDNENNQTIECRLNYNGQRIHHLFAATSINVTSRDIIATGMYTHTINEGDKENLMCVAGEANPPSTIYWFRQKFQGDESVDVTRRARTSFVPRRTGDYGFRLKSEYLVRATPSDDGSYVKCVIGENRSLFKKAHFIVHHGPSLELNISSSNIEPPVNSSATIVLNVVSNPSATAVSCSQENKETAYAGRRIQPDDGVWLITVPIHEADDYGNYVCTGVNENNIQKTAVVTIANPGSFGMVKVLVTAVSGTILTGVLVAGVLIGIRRRCKRKEEPAVTLTEPYLTRDKAFLREKLERSLNQRNITDDEKTEILTLLRWEGNWIEWNRVVCIDNAVRLIERTLMEYSATANKKSPDVLKTMDQLLTQETEEIDALCNRNEVDLFRKRVICYRATDTVTRKYMKTSCATIFENQIEKFKELITVILDSRISELSKQVPSHSFIVSRIQIDSLLREKIIFDQASVDGMREIIDDRIRKIQGNGRADIDLLDDLTEESEDGQIVLNHANRIGLNLQDEILHWALDDLIRQHLLVSSVNSVYRV
ncbi:uncharacterized protein LOC141906835 isoform X2 [Tubulanus polymorphus]|uniref:uncharacterized protein LOC141906835 isoform X2 n=1 Tax=Tubulanus polymorphus TaxID=672921 RepID=UPI003DA25929